MNFGVLPSDMLEVACLGSMPSFDIDFACSGSGSGCEQLTELGNPKLDFGGAASFPKIAGLGITAWAPGCDLAISMLLSGFGGLFDLERTDLCSSSDSSTKSGSSFPAEEFSASDESSTRP